MHTDLAAGRRSAFSKRWLLVLVSVFALLLLGLIYAWSIFVKPLEQEFLWQRSETSMAFSICMSMFCLGGIFAGFFLRRYSSRLVLLICAVCLGAGFTLASLISSLTGLYATYGVLVGFGVGAGYNAILSSVLRWFPEKVGFVSGLLMMGFGFGGMVLGTLGSMLLESMGWRSTFMVIGVVLAVIIALCSFFIAPPNSAEAARLANSSRAAKVTGLEVSTKNMLKMPSFWLYFCWASLLTGAGLMLIGHAVPLVGGLGALPERAAFLAGFISVFNGLGRVLMGFAFDRLGYKWVMRMVSIGFIVSGIILICALKAVSIPFALVGFILAGLSFGGVLPCNSSVIGTFYGMRNYAMNFSMINMCAIVASFLGPYFAGVLHTSSGSYSSMVFMMACFGLAGLVLAFFVRTPR